MKVYADKIFAAMRNDARQRIEAHNAQYADQRRSYPARIKIGDENCLWNILRAWSAQAAHAINTGQPVTNRVEINNKDAQDGRRDKSNVGRYLGKLGLAGLIGARRATEQDPARYRCQFTQSGRGFGWAPVKRFRGTLSDYTVLIDPALIPLGAIPPGTPIFLLDEVRHVDGRTYKVESFKVSLDKTKFINKEMSLSGAASPQSAAKTEEGQAPQAKPVAQGVQEEFPAAAPSETAASTAPAIPAGIAGINDAPATPETVVPADASGLERMYRLLWDEGKEIAALAMLLVASYFKKLVPAMGREEGDYVPSQRAKAVQVAQALLASYTDPNKAADVFLLTIDRMQGAIQHSPSTYVAPPGLWFDPEYPFNIEKAYEKYLVPWENTRVKLAELSQRRAMVAKLSDLEEEKIANQDRYHGLAYSLKTNLMRHHPTDLRLRGADLSHWAMSIRLLVEKDRVPYQRAVEVAKWWLLSDHQEARFFRAEMGRAGTPLGIRSARGFRRHFHAMETAYDQVQRKAS